jgi:uncharacterized protein YciI
VSGRTHLLSQRRALLLAPASLASAGAAAQLPAASAPAASAAPELPLFAVEIKTGPKWDAAKPPPEQPYFREHSAHLRKLREAGHIRLGARYADKGLIVIAAPTIEDARGWIDADPSIQHGTFAYELHPFAVFYGGTVAPVRRR